MRRKNVARYITGFVFAVLCFVVLNALMKPVSTSEYCGGKCHEMAGAYRTWELSPHGANRAGIRVECVDCHLPPKDRYFKHLVVKAYAGGKDLYKHHFGGEYDSKKMSRHVLDHLPDERCVHCHDDLLNKTANHKARLAHAAIANNPDESDSRCIACHDTVGHERQSRLFSP